MTNVWQRNHRNVVAVDNVRDDARAILIAGERGVAPGVVPGVRPIDLVTGLFGFPRTPTFPNKETS